jgi:hypothetical protein
MPLNRKYTEAMERLAKAKTRLADSDEKFHAAFLEWFSAENRARKSAPGTTASRSEALPQKQPPKK